MIGQKKSNPVLLDRIIQALQDNLEQKLPWLDHALGRSYKLEREKEGKSSIFPAVYSGNGDYMQVFPDDTLGNFSFFEIYDPIEIDDQSITPKVTVKGAIIFWLNAATIYSDVSVLYNEEIKAEIIKALTTSRLTPGNRLSLLKIYEDPANIYKGYDIKQIDNQYLISPYYGLRIEIELKSEELCRH